jgi:hypothetical protein
MVSSSPGDRRSSSAGQPSDPGALRSVLRTVAVFAVGLGLILIAGIFSPVPSYVVIVAACAFLGYTLGSPVPKRRGMADHKQ